MSSYCGPWIPLLSSHYSGLSGNVVMGEQWWQSGDGECEGSIYWAWSCPLTSPQPLLSPACFLATRKIRIQTSDSNLINSCFPSGHVNGQALCMFTTTEAQPDSSFHLFYSLTQSGTTKSDVREQFRSLFLFFLWEFTNIRGRGLTTTHLVEDLLGKLKEKKNHSHYIFL